MHKVYAYGLDLWPHDFEYVLGSMPFIESNHIKFSENSSNPFKDIAQTRILHKTLTFDLKYVIC